MSIIFFCYTAHCQKSTYSIGLQRYDALSGASKLYDTESSNITTEGENNINKSSTEKYRNLAFYYATTDVTVSKSSEVIDLPTFISNVGGNLGLFLGFSVLGGFAFIYELIVAHCGSLNRLK